jgi:hypothetical protein
LRGARVGGHYHASRFLKTSVVTLSELLPKRRHHF